MIIVWYLVCCKWGQQIVKQSVTIHSWREQIIIWWIWFFCIFLLLLNWYPSSFKKRTLFFEMCKTLGQERVGGGLLTEKKLVFHLIASSNIQYRWEMCIKCQIRILKCFKGLNENFLDISCCDKRFGNITSLVYRCVSIYCNLMHLYVLCSWVFRLVNWFLYIFCTVEFTGACLVISYRCMHMSLRYLFHSELVPVKSFFYFICWRASFL